MSRQGLEARTLALKTPTKDCYFAMCCYDFHGEETILAVCDHFPLTFLPGEVIGMFLAGLESETESSHRRLLVLYQDGCPRSDRQ